MNFVVVLASSFELRMWNNGGCKNTWSLSISGGRTGNCECRWRNDPSKYLRAASSRLFGSASTFRMRLVLFLVDAITLEEDANTGEVKNSTSCMSASAINRRRNCDKGYMPCESPHSIIYIRLLVEADSCFTNRCSSVMALWPLAHMFVRRVQICKTLIVPESTISSRTLQPISRITFRKADVTASRQTSSHKI